MTTLKVKKNDLAQDSTQTFWRRWAGSRWGGVTHGGKRDLWESFGYPAAVSLDQLWAMYKRGGIANRIVKAYPQATWRDEPICRDEQGNGIEAGKKNFSEFALACNEFFDQKKIMRHLDRADRVASIGRYGILVMGFADGRPLNEELKEGKKAKLEYMSCYAEQSVTVQTWDQDTASPRFGLPITYTVTPQKQNDILQKGEQGSTGTFVVHFTRCIHISEFLDESDVYGTPRLLPLYNDLLDLNKVTGGGAETFWLTANRGIMFTADKDSPITAEELDVMQEQADAFSHQLRRDLIGRGITASVLDTGDPRPKENADALLQLIAGASGIPLRILIGSERGELSSNQDENNWAARIDERRRNFAGPSILQPFVNKMIATGNLPEPKGKGGSAGTKDDLPKWWIEWPPNDLGPKEESVIAKTKTETISLYGNSPAAQQVVPLPEFRQMIGLPPVSEFADDNDVEDDLPEDGEDIVPLPGEPGSNKLPVDGAKPADQALNGAQITALQGIVEAVALKQLPTETAILLIVSGFPQIGEKEARAMLAPMATFEPAPEPGKEPAPVQEPDNTLPEDEEPAIPDEGPVSVPDALAEAVRNSKMKSVWAYRTVQNAGALRRWAKANKIYVDKNTQFHVTLCYSTKPVDWSTMKGQPITKEKTEAGEDVTQYTDTIEPDNSRRVSVFGDSVVLAFKHAQLSNRHEEFRNHGATHDHDEFIPHITIAGVEDMGRDLADVIPYTGPIVLGREQYEEIEE